LCILCKKEKECDIDNSEVEEDDDSTFDASESSDPEEDENMPTPKRCTRLSLVEGNCNRRDDSEEYLPEGSKRSRPSSSLNNAPTNGHVVEQKEQFARMDTFIRDSSNFFKEVTKLREEHAKLKPAHSIALMKVDRLRKERTSLRADCETSEQRVISEANKKRAETLRADRLQREVLQLEQALKQQRRTESTAATSYSSSPATSRTPTFDESKQGTPQSTQVDKGVDDEAARVFQQVVNLRKEIEGCETEAMVIRSELGPRLDEYKSMEAKVEELGRGLGPKLDRLKANEAKTEKLRSDLKAGADRYSQLLRA
jgi:chromosome segregation ATPase